jgi:hypothetical protein
MEQLKRKSIFLTKDIINANLAQEGTMKGDTGKFITRLDILRKKHGKEKLKLNLIH